MPKFTNVRNACCDAITGERLKPSDSVFDTEIANRRDTMMARSRTRLVKEETIVWLAEQAGYVITKRDAGDSGDTKNVDEPDVSVGNGEAEVGKPKAGGKSTSKRRSDGPVKD